jgi:hypothetical protein
MWLLLDVLLILLLQGKISRRIVITCGKTWNKKLVSCCCFIKTNETNCWEGGNTGKHLQIMPEESSRRVQTPLVI